MYTMWPENAMPLLFLNIKWTVYRYFK